MQRIIIIIVCFLLTTVLGFSQNRKTPVRSSPPKQIPAVAAAIDKVPESDWNEITRALSVEDWNKTALLSGNLLKSLKFENDSRQLARLRYFYLFSLAGKVGQGKMTVAELQNIIQTFVGTEFIMLDRNVLANCNNSLNYVCPAKDDKNSLRVTATNKEFTVIHSFEYVKLLQAFNFTANNLKNVFVRGILKRFEVNQKPDKVWIMRLYFEDGWVQVIDKK